ncbi:LptA/OstA family protein [Phenylobacterium sp.]|jgi:lipopolysaccharide export system protein LptA|uniref:LptA/OstA family protein n=1 Tax=Phenylobacterium sp. TaxID=1871053 RepID=UPI002E36303D|nr:LptA/OstA family protein [Phenylobacterium sp.]HEX4710439.1 LptA/OstA family protein [Phenylobacterium sp.]
MKSLIAMALAVATLAAAQPAAAQLAKNSKGPIDITADEGETHNADCTAIWRGSAEALQETSRLRSDVLIAHMEVKKNKPGGAAPGADSGSACGEMVSLEAKGNVYYVSADGRRVHGDAGLYDAINTTLTVTGDVVAVDGQNVMRGTRMVYNTQTGEGRVEGGAKGPSAKNRPRGVFYPKNSSDQAATSSAATSSAATSPAAASPADKPKKAAK